MGIFKSEKWFSTEEASRKVHLVWTLKSKGESPENLLISATPECGLLPETCRELNPGLHPIRAKQEGGPVAWEAGRSKLSR